MFNQLGYFKEYYVGRKYIGSHVSEMDRDFIGYNGQRLETLKESVLLDNKKKIKVGTEVMTIIYPLCGKIIRNNNSITTQC
jgi:hypothetical protein